MPAHTMRSTTASWLPLPKPSKSITTLALRGIALPASAEATALALADRLDTLVGIFGIGEPPTGSKDPFALRRASLAVVRMLIAVERPLAANRLAPKRLSTTFGNTLGRYGRCGAPVHSRATRRAGMTSRTSISPSSARYWQPAKLICSISIFGCAHSPRLPGPTPQSTLPPPTSGSRISSPKQTRRMATRRTPRFAGAGRGTADKKPSLCRGGLAAR